MGNLLIIFLAYSPILLISLIKYFFYNLAVYDPINLLFFYTLFTIIQYILNDTNTVLNLDFILLVFSSNLIIFIFYFLTFKTNLLKINLRRTRLFIKNFEINFKNSENYFSQQQ